MFDHITYSLDMYSYGKVIETQKSFVQSNYWDIPYPYLLSPYEDVQHEVIFTSYMPEAFQLLGESNLTVEIPSIKSRYLEMNGKKAQYISTKQSFPYHNTEQKEILIPPSTIQRITLMLEYERFETQYTLYAFHPKTKKQRIITGMLQSKMPVDYHIKRENINE